MKRRTSSPTMKTSVIRYRVADFLRENPPFDSFSLEDLLAFSGTGRVTFHEDDVEICQKGAPLQGTLWVIQQGKIELLDQTPVGVRLADVIGPGDIFGLARKGPIYPFTARTATEVILYAFDMSTFADLVEKYPAAARFLTAHLSSNTRHTKALQAPGNRDRLLTEREKSVWLNAQDLPAEWASRRLVTCSARTPVCVAATRMSQAHSEAVAVVSGDGTTLGLISLDEFGNQVATAAVSIDAPAETVMNRRFVTMPPNLRPADYLLEMLRGRSRALAVTEDGSADSPIQGILTDSDLTVGCGRNPVALVRKLLAAESVADLAYLRGRVDAFLSEGLVGPSTVEWFSRMLGEVNAVLLERATQLAEAQLARVGVPHPGSRSCWLFFGRAGRRETLAPFMPDVGIVYDDSPRSRQSPQARGYFETLAGEVATILEGCGLRPRKGASGPSSHPLSEWKQYYTNLVRDPIGNAIYAARERFDFSVACGDPSLGAELEATILVELEREDAFIPVIANDTIAHLPPLTFFQGQIIEQDGTLRHTLDIETTALGPIVDAARVFALARRDMAVSNTFHRLASAARELPHYASILSDAAEALRIVAYHHAAAGLAKQDDDSVIFPMRLSKFEQRLLKTAFDSTRRFLELASSIHNVEVHR
jgi:CBS domain-containing protein